MDQVLVPNPEGCEEFARHQFKKDRCKNCNKRWQEHLGVISEKLLAELLAEQKETEGRRRREEQQAKELARAKARAKKKAAKKKTRTAEDDWFFSGEESSVASSGDENVGFQMMGGDEEVLPRSVDPHRRRSFSHQPKVVNLIDFSECAEDDEPAPEPLDGISPATSSTADPLSSPAVMWVPPSGPIPLVAVAEEGALGLTEEQLFIEVEHLRQRLKDADVERSVQVSIVRDEVEEKQRVIEELEQQRSETEAKLKEALQQVEILRQERDAAAMAAAAAAEAAEALESAAAAAAAQQGSQPAAAELERAEAAAQQGDPLEPTLLEPAEEMDLVKPLNVGEIEPQLQLRPRARGGLIWALMEQKYWIKCLQSAGDSDQE